MFKHSSRKRPLTNSRYGVSNQLSPESANLPVVHPLVRPRKNSNGRPIAPTIISKTRPASLRLNPTIAFCTGGQFASSGIPRARMSTNIVFLLNPKQSCRSNRSLPNSSSFRACRGISPESSAPPTGAGGIPRQVRNDVRLYPVTYAWALKRSFEALPKRRI